MRRIRKDFRRPLPNKRDMTKPISPSTSARSVLSRRELARRALAGTAGVLLAAALPARSQVVDPNLAVPPPLPTSLPTPPAKAMPMSNIPPSESQLLIQLVPVAAGYTLSDTQAKEAALQLKDYPGGFAKARAYPLPDSVGPAFAADAPVRKERVK